MINISSKITTLRFAKAGGSIRTTKDLIRKIIEDDIPQGDVLKVSRMAGIQAAKKTSELLFFCHNLPLEWVDISFQLENDTIYVKAEAEAIARTGVEMEVLTAASITLLNIYDMLKPLDKEMEINSVHLLEKAGGKSNFSEDFEYSVKAALLRISNSVVDGSKEDHSTGTVVEILGSHGVETDLKKVIRSDKKELMEEIIKLVDDEHYHLLFTIGATGLDKQDIISDVTEELIDYNIPGISEAMREFGRNRTPYANYSRMTAGVRGKTILINLPGSSRGAEESVRALFPGLKHALRMMNKGKLREIK